MAKRRIRKIENGILILVSSNRQVTRFQNCDADLAEWPNSKKLEFMWTRIPRYKDPVVLASLIM
jgi:hypothetical protein